MRRWQYDFNASGCWIVDEEGFTIITHMPITVEQAKAIVHEHNRETDELAALERKVQSLDTENNLLVNLIKTLTKPPEEND